MTALPRPERLTAQDYLRRERLAEGRAEYQRGEVVELRGEGRSHGRLKTNLLARLAE